ncbi:MAG: TonB-dependent receptor [Saprospiraceae bacterium]|nr:TonB-dependent receptor [Saprospiraceae bacterium]
MKKDIDPNEFKIDISTLKSLYGKEEINAKEINIYVEDLSALGSSTSLNAGINYSIMPGQKKYSSFQPRLAFLVEGEHLHFKTGISRMQQYMHLLSNNGLGFPSDVWLPSSPLLSPQKSWILNTAFGYRLNSGLKFGMEAYYKSFDKVSSFNEGASLNINENIDWQYDIPIGNGYAYGLEMYAEKVIGKTLFGANYTYSISDRRFEDLNIGRTFPFGLNRNHSFKFSFTYRLSDFSEFLLNWSYMTGNYYSQPINVTIDINGKPIVLFPEKNNAQYPAFHRMDVGFSFYNTYKWGRAKFFLGLYNAYNRNNPFYTELVRDKENDARFEFKQFSLLPLLPTISYSISF